MPQPKPKQNKKNKKKNQQNKKKKGNHHNNKGRNNNNKKNENKNKNKNKNKKKQGGGEEMKIDESLEIRGINLVPMENYKECGQTYPPSKPVKDLWEEKEYEIIQTMPHPNKGKKYVIVCLFMR